MPEARFDRLTDRLLRAGVAPRHVHRTVRELSDHFDDLVAEERANGVEQQLAQTRALSRLGSEDDLAAAILARPELRSFMARHPWAVFGLGPALMLAVTMFAALLLEYWLLDNSRWFFHGVMGMTPGPVAARLATQIFTGYNTLFAFGAPLLFAALLYAAGMRQRISPGWIATGVAALCVLGGFVNLIYYDIGVVHGGRLIVQFGLLPPFAHFAQGLARAAMNLILAGAAWLWAARRNAALTLSQTART